MDMAVVLSCVLGVSAAFIWVRCTGEHAVGTWGWYIMVVVGAAASWSIAASVF